jgi:acetyl-CoA acetyltransferase family protein
LLTYVYNALFERNPQVKPENVEAVFCGSANQSGMQNDIARLAWLASGLPDSVATNGVNQQCPSGMSCLEHAARAIMCGEGDIYIASGVEDMMNVPMAANMDIPPRIVNYYNPMELPMGPTAEKIAELYNISREDAELMAYHSHIKAREARDAGKFKDEIVPVPGHDENGQEMLVDRDQWIRDNPSLEQMAAMQPAFKPDGVVTAAISSPLTVGACAALLMSREKADELGMSYHLRYGGGAMAGCDPTVMGIGPVPACRKLLERKELTVNDIDVWELNEAFGTQSLAVIRELGIGHNAPFENINIWGGALALGHPLGESGCRIVITLNNIMKKDLPDAKRGVAMLCGGFGNANATLWEKVE